METTKSMRNWLEKKNIEPALKKDYIYTHEEARLHRRARKINQRLKWPSVNDDAEHTTRK